ncbi:MAG: DUF6607 family protein, partial [Planctomycetota bacterium]
ELDRPFGNGDQALSQAGFPVLVCPILCTIVLAIASVDAVQDEYAADREAILGMAGAFEVSFRFEETVAVDAAYTLREPYSERALELVEVIADKPGYISLQHVLLVEGDEPGAASRVVKHWRQDWIFEDARVLSYQGPDADGNKTWLTVTRSHAEVAGTWTQAVFQTTDAPRYESVGRWTHVGGVSSWESEATWRPLPRREYKTRSDYHVVACRNRHTVTSRGWSHEPDTQTVVLSDAGAPVAVIAHEVGLNTYTRTEGERLAEAQRYWREHETAWADVREAWARLLQRPGITLHGSVDGVSLHKVVGDAVRSARADGTGLASLQATLANYVGD